MTKKPDHAQNESATQDAIEQAIAGGKAIISEGKAKIDAAMSIYSALLGADQDTVVSAFIEGASLSPKGAVTYWYNCRRKYSRMKAAAGE